MHTKQSFPWPRREKGSITGKGVLVTSTSNTCKYRLARILNSASARPLRLNFVRARSQRVEIYMRTTGQARANANQKRGEIERTANSSVNNFNENAGLRSDVNGWINNKL